MSVERDNRVSRDIRACRMHEHDLMRVYAPHLLIEKTPEPAPPPPPAPPVVADDPASVLAGLCASTRVKDLAYRVCMDHGMTWSEVLTRSQSPKFVAARSDLYAGLIEFGWSGPRIGELVGRDHTTIVAAMRKRRRSA